MSWRAVRDSVSAETKKAVLDAIGLDDSHRLNEVNWGVVGKNICARAAQKSLEAVSFVASYAGGGILLWGMAQLHKHHGDKVPHALEESDVLFIALPSSMLAAVKVYDAGGVLGAGAFVLATGLMAGIGPVLAEEFKHRADILPGDKLRTKKPVEEPAEQTGGDTKEPPFRFLIPVVPKAQSSAAIFAADLDPS